MFITDETVTLPAIGPGPIYSDRHVWLPQLVVEAAQAGASVVEGKTFTRCMLEGPAVLLPIEGCNFDRCNMGDALGDPRNLLLTPEGSQRVIGAVAFRNCQFLDCSFLRVGFTGTPAFLDQLRLMLSGGRQA